MGLSGVAGEGSRGSVHKAALLVLLAVGEKTGSLVPSWPPASFPRAGETPATSTAPKAAPEYPRGEDSSPMRVSSETEVRALGLLLNPFKMELCGILAFSFRCFSVFPTLLLFLLHRQLEGRPLSRD